MASSTTLSDYLTSKGYGNSIPTTIGSYSNALATTPQDYNDIYSDYGDVAANPVGAAPITTSPILANPIQYSTSPAVTQSLNDLSSLASTGGYSDADIANIRARSVSPIRSTFAAAQQGLNQSKQLQGGYSPNYAAATAKMARDQSNQIAQSVTNINAQIAQNVAQNKLAAASPFASAASSEASRGQNASEFNSNNASQTAQFNANNASQTQQFNAGTQENAANRKLEAIGGQRSLYGTTPALASTFGNQALGAAQLNSSNQNQFLNRNLTGQNSLLSGF